jgi:hypothetical protein
MAPLTENQMIRQKDTKLAHFLVGGGLLCGDGGGLVSSDVGGLVYGNGGGLVGDPISGLH